MSMVCFTGRWPCITDRRRALKRFDVRDGLGCRLIQVAGHRGGLSLSGGRGGASPAAGGPFSHSPRAWWEIKEQGPATSELAAWVGCGGGADGLRWRPTSMHLGCGITLAAAHPGPTQPELRSAPGRSGATRAPPPAGHGAIRALAEGSCTRRGRMEALLSQAGRNPQCLSSKKGCRMLAEGP